MTADEAGKATVQDVMLNVAGCIARTTANKAVEVLNEALKADSEAMSRLISSRVSCNTKLADHPTIQVIEEKGQTLVGLIGIVNGIVERQTGERLCAVYKDDSMTKLTGFCLLSDVKPGKK